MKLEKYKKIFFLSLAIAVLLFSYNFQNIKKASADQQDCSKLSGDAQNQCQDLEKKAQAYQQIIDLKNKQQDTLATQMQLINQEQAKNLVDLQQAQKDNIDLAQKIQNLENDINDQEITIKSQKKILAGLMRSYYEYDQEGLLGLVVLDQNLSDIFNQSDYIQQSSVKASDVLSEIIKAKNDLKAAQEDLIQKKQESDDMKDILTSKQDDLQTTESQKQVLLTQTQGEEVKYQQLLANVEAEKKELFNFSAASNIDEIKASVGSYPKPSDHLASTDWYFSQTDSRWANQKIGTSSSIMADYGCAVTSLAMVFRKMGSGIDPGKLAKQKMFAVDLIEWPDSWSPGITLASSIGHGNINWSTINSQIAKGNPVIVHINKTNGQGGHYVVITGKDSKDYIVHDPYFGSNLYLSTSKSLVGKIGKDSKTAVDQMIIYN